MPAPGRVSAGLRSVPAEENTSLVERPDVEFTRTADGTYLAYQVFGDGPITLLWAEDTFAMVDSWWESPQERAWHEGLAGFARIVVHDRRGIGMSSRNVAPGNLEIQVADILEVLDAVGAERCALGGFFEAGAPNALLAATYPELVSAEIDMGEIVDGVQEITFKRAVGTKG